jgi:prepilin-type N-terminal cleavage/methylation domain-containing protein
MKHKSSTRRKNQRGFTLIEMLIASVVVIFGLVAVAQLVPASVMLNSDNRNDGTALVFAQRQMDVLRSQPLTATTFADSNGISCPLSQTCLLGDPTPARAYAWVGCDVQTVNNAPMIVFSDGCEPTSGYNFLYTDPNDPSGATYDVRWSIMTAENTSNAVVYRRIVVGVFRRGMQTTTLPIILDVQVLK